MKKARILLTLVLCVSLVLTLIPHTSSMAQEQPSCTCAQVCTDESTDAECTVCIAQMEDCAAAT